mgnify:FL=1
MSSIIRVNDIQDAGGNSIISSNGSGTFTSNINNVNFFVRPSSNQSISNNTLTTVVFDSEIFDVGSNFASNGFTAPTTAKYCFNYGVRFGSSSNDANEFTTIVLLNGSDLFGVGNNNALLNDMYTSGNNHGNGTSNNSFILSLTANDIITIQAKQNNNGGGAGSVKSSGTFFCGYKLGA